MRYYKCINPTPDLIKDKVYVGEPYVLYGRRDDKRIKILNGKRHVHYYVYRFKDVTFTHYADNC